MTMKTIENKTVRPTHRPHMFIITDHYEFDGRPATQEHLVYESTTCNAYHDAVNKRGWSYEDVYVGPKAIEIDGYTYYYPVFQPDSNE